MEIDLYVQQNKYICVCVRVSMSACVSLRVYLCVFVCAYQAGNHDFAKNNSWLTIVWEEETVKRRSKQA